VSFEGPAAPVFVVICQLSFVIGGRSHRLCALSDEPAFGAREAGIGNQERRGDARHGGQALTRGRGDAGMERRVGATRETRSPSRRCVGQRLQPRSIKPPRHREHQEALNHGGTEDTEKAGSTGDLMIRRARWLRTVDSVSCPQSHADFRRFEFEKSLPTDYTD